MSTDQGHFFCMYYFVYTSASTSRENFMASRRADKHTTHEKSNSWERIHRTLPFHLTSTRRAHRLCANGLICCFNVAFSVIDCSFSIKNGFTDADCLFLGSHVFLKAGHPVDCCKLTVKGILSSLLQYLSLFLTHPPRPSFWQISPINTVSAGRPLHREGNVGEEGGIDLRAFIGCK